MPVCPGTEEREEADSQTDLQGPACETEPADVLIMGEVSKLLAHIELNKPVRCAAEGAALCHSRWLHTVYMFNRALGCMMTFCYRILYNTLHTCVHLGAVI